MTQPQQFPDANDLLMGSGVKSCKFDTLGDTWVGTIIEQPKTQQMTKYQSSELDYWPSGDPKLQVVVTIQTDVREDADDDGKRKLFIIPRMRDVVREAVQKTGARGLAIGGRIAVRWVSGTGQGEGNPKVYAAQYEPPQVDPGDLLGTGQQGQAQASAPPATAPVMSTATGQPVVHNQQLPPAAPAAAAAPVTGGQPATPAGAAAPASTPPASGGDLLGSTPTAGQVDVATPPPGVDPQIWAGLPEAQRRAALAAFANVSAFAPQQPF